MKSSAPDNGTATVVCDGGMIESLAPPAFIDHSANPVVVLRPAPKSHAGPHPGDPAQAQGGNATRRERRRARRGVRGRTAASDSEATPAWERAYYNLRTLILSGRIAPDQRLGRAPGQRVRNQPDTYPGGPSQTRIGRVDHAAFEAGVRCLPRLAERDGGTR
jgi:hypothetical protein